MEFHEEQWLIYRQLLLTYSVCLNVNASLNYLEKDEVLEDLRRLEELFTNKTDDPRYVSLRRGIDIAISGEAWRYNRSVT